MDEYFCVRIKWNLAGGDCWILKVKAEKIFLSGRHNGTILRKIIFEVSVLVAKQNLDL